MKIALFVWRSFILGFGLIIGSASGMLPLCRETQLALSSWNGCRVQIGGWASSGIAAYSAAFAPTFELFLNQQLNASHGLEFESIPLSSDSLWDAVTNGLDFVFVNPAQFVCLMTEKGAIAIATLISTAAGVELENFAGLMIARVNSSINTLEDLRHARVEAAALTSLGGGQLQFMEMMNANLHPMVDIHRLTFGKTQDEVVRDVLSGHADVGFVRHDTLHIEVARGSARLEDFKIINLLSSTNDDGFPFDRSTGLSPEWPVAAMPHVPHEVTRLVMLELFRLDASSSNPELSAPARSGNYAGFTRALNYYDLLTRLSATGFFDANTQSCPAATSTYDAIVCPPSHFKQAEDNIFCKEGCREGQHCLCEPCLPRPDPEVIFNMDSLPHVFPLYVDTEAVKANTSFASECARLEVCASVAAGQLVQARFLDRVGASNRLRLGLSPIENVTVCALDGACKHLIFNSQASPEDSYVLNMSFTSVGTQIMNLQINGVLAELSPMLVYVFEAPVRVAECPDGHEFILETGLCVACKAGTKLSEGKCIPCTYGHYADEDAATDCHDCVTGTEALEPGASACDLCRPGRASSGYGSKSRCDLCEPGYVAAVPGMSKCEECEPGFYMDQYGGTNCTQCPENTATVDGGQTSNSSCGCLAGLYRGWSGNCENCPEGMLCELGSDVRNFPGLAGRCAGTFCTFPRTKPGFMTLSSDPLSVYRCMSEEECPGAPPSSVSSCGLNRALNELACGLCEEDSYVTRSGKCKVCAGNTSASIIILVALAFVLAVMTLGVSVNRDVVTQRKPVTTAIILCGVFFTMFQTLSVFDKLSLDWVDPVKSAVVLASALSFDITELRVSCHVSPKSIITGRYLCRQLIAPASIPLLFIAIFMKQRLTKRKASSQVGVRIQLCNACGTIFSIFFISVVLSAIDPLVCYKHPEDSGNGSSMISEPAVQCWRGSRHPLLVFIGLVAFVVVPLTFLAMCSYAILLYPKIVNSRDKQERAKLHAFRFLFFRFKPEAYFYGLLVLFRNLTICLIPAVVPTEEIGIQIITICMILLTSGSAQATLAPWRTFISNVIDTSATVSLVLIILTGVLSTDIPKNGAAPETVGAITLIGAITLLFAALVHSIYCRCCRHGARFDYFLCHHKQAAAAQSRYLQLLLRSKMSCSCFLDSDDLKDLSMLFETIKSSVKHFLVFLTRETLRRPWCAGEITIARQIKVMATAIVHPSFAPISDAQLRDLFSYLDLGSGMKLVEHYIDLEHVAEAFQWLNSEEMPKIPVAPEFPGRLAFDMVIKSLQTGTNNLKANAGMNRSSESSIASSCFELPVQTLDTVLVSCDYTDLEAIAASGILMQKLSIRIAHTMKGDFYLLADAQRMPATQDLQMCLANARAVIVMMTGGTLECIQQIQVIVGTMALGIGARSIPVSMPEFIYPNQAYFEEVLPRFFDVNDVDETRRALQSFFGLIAISLATHAADAILVTQCGQVFARIGEKVMAEKNAAILKVNLPVAMAQKKNDEDMRALMKDVQKEHGEISWASEC